MIEVLIFVVALVAAVTTTFVVCRAQSDQRLAEAQAACRRSHEALTRAVVGLAGATDEPAMRDAVLQLVPAALGGSGAAVIIREQEHWRTLAATTPAMLLDNAECDRLAAAAAGDAGTEALAEQHDAMWVPLLAEGGCVGMLGVAGIGGAAGDHLAVKAVAAPLALAVRNAALRRPMAHLVRDPLTLCFTEAYALEVIDNELRRARRSQMPMALLIVDIDQLSELRGRHGNACRDAVLGAVGHCLQHLLRASDSRCRFRDDSFGILLPETPLEGAIHVADTLRREIAALPIAWSERVLSVTASVGVTRGHVSDKTAHAAISRATAALQRAHAEGSNCVRPSTEFIAI